MNTSICKSCGKELEEGTKICPYCGFSVENIDTANSEQGQKQAVEPEPKLELEQQQTVEAEPELEQQQTVEAEPELEQQQAVEAEPELEQQQTVESEPKLEQQQTIVKPDKKKIISIAIAVVVVIVVAIVGMRMKQQHDYEVELARQQHEKEVAQAKEKLESEEAFNAYISNLKEAQDAMLEGGERAENLGGFTLRIWYDYIYREDDEATREYVKPNGIFLNDINDVLDNYYNKQSTKDTISFIWQNEDDVADILKKLQNPPEGLEKCYDIVLDLYSNYQQLVKISVDPVGKYDNVSNKFNTSRDNFFATSDKLDTQIPDEIKIEIPDILKEENAEET